MFYERSREFYHVRLSGRSPKSCKRPQLLTYQRVGERRAGFAVQGEVALLTAKLTLSTRRLQARFRVARSLVNAIGLERPEVGLHNWLLVPIPLASRVWAMPFLRALAHPERYAKDRGKRHKKLTE